MDASKNHPHRQSATETTNWAPAFSVAGVIFNYALIIVFLLLAWHKGWLADLWQWCEEYPVYASAIGTALAGWLGQVVNHKVKTTGRVNTPFKHTHLLDIPTDRIGYSDRTAYLLAELSDLAYLDVVPSAPISKEVADYLKTQSHSTDAFVDEVIAWHRFYKQNDNVSSKKAFEQDLQKANLSLAGTPFNVGSTQGFVCVRHGSDPFIAVVFRGSEKKIEDWLTNSRYGEASAIEGDGLVHSGFQAACHSVFSDIRKQIESAAGQLQKPFTLYFTGHSLGGALAILCARHLEYTCLREKAKPYRAVCYTFGAPRIASYDYFTFMKTPVYRVVNSADIVPRLPPGAWAGLLGKSVAYLRGAIPGRWIDGWLETIELATSKLKYFRHHGDLRYLPEVSSLKDSQMKNLKILSNPNQLDTAFWFWRRVAVSLGMPVKSHSMRLYVEKLAAIATSRCKQNENND